MQRTNKSIQNIKFRENPNDEFYTLYQTVENECVNYIDYFKGATIYCNCDDYSKSNFFQYFATNFASLKLKKFICTFYTGNQNDTLWDEENTILNKITIDESGQHLEALKGNGDFRSQECIDILKESDIIITNPPFSLFKDWVELVQKYNKLFLVMGTILSINNADIFSYVCHNKMWWGKSLHGNNCAFIVPDDTQCENSYIDKVTKLKMAKINNSVWYTNMVHNDRKQFIELKKEYNEKDYPKYDSFDAINIDRITDIPKNYYGKMGVPITFLDYYNPKQFTLLGALATKKVTDTNLGYPTINGKKKFTRLIIQAKK